ncbi:MAG: hypothetical protein ACRD8A_15465 [Candidatus Acidiferrales bacterium]
MASATKSIPFVVPAQHVPAAEAISQTELALYLSLRSRLQEIKLQTEEQEQAFAARLESGAGVEPGAHKAELKESFRRSVAWKSVTIRLADRLKLDGEAYCARVLAATKPDRSVSLLVS